MTAWRTVIESRWSNRIRVAAGEHDREAVVAAPAELLVDVSRALVHDGGLVFASLVTEQSAQEAADFVLRYLFVDPLAHGVVTVVIPASGTEIPSISDTVHAADWHEREVEDLFGLVFAGHPVLGDFVLHDATWPEAVAPMRHAYQRLTKTPRQGRRETWRPKTLLHEPGAQALPIGPVFSDFAEAILFVLESSGEQIRRCLARPFYKYRGVEKLAEGRSPDDVLLLAERFSGGSAFADALALCQALESIATVEIPTRAAWLRVVFAELERLRSHVATIAGICGATALVVAKAQAQDLEEELLRLSAELTGHRYLFGVAVAGGVTVDISPPAALRLEHELLRIEKALAKLEQGLRFSSSFLDRLEEVGTVSITAAAEHGVVGPVARASGSAYDLRTALPYAAYGELRPQLAHENQGDGYARLRVFFAEARTALALIATALRQLPEGNLTAPITYRAGIALGATEAPAGATYHWVRVSDDGVVARYHIAPPSLANLHALRLAVEGFAFQDFPIVLSTFNLSIAESDR